MDKSRHRVESISLSVMKHQSKKPRVLCPLVGTRVDTVGQSRNSRRPYPDTHTYKINKYIYMILLVKRAKDFNNKYFTPKER